jgi:hypothetical protein
VRLDAPHILTALEVAAAVAAGYLFVVVVIVLAALPRLRSRWQAHQPARVPVPGADRVTVQARLVEILGPWGFRPSGPPDGPFTLEPHGMRKWQGAKPISVTFPGGQAVVTGEARYVAKLTADRKVWFVAEGAVPFWPWVRQRLATTMAVLTAILFVSVFLVALSF